LKRVSDTEIETLQINCDGKIHKIVKYHLNPTDTILIDSLNKGAELAGKVNINDPSGVPRDVAKRVAKCSGGVIAEKIFNDFLAGRMRDEAKIKSKLSEIELFVPPADYSKGQIDLILRSRVDKKPILRVEVRSSFSYKTASIDNVVRYAMSLLGPYITTTKPFEETKDFHVTVIHRVDPAELLSRSRKQGIDSYVVGGGTKQMFQDSKLRNIDDLYQKGAAYMTIKPMWKGLDAYNVVESIIAGCLKYFGVSVP
jgi:hypothetical protein